MGRWSTILDVIEPQPPVAALQSGWWAVPTLRVVNFGGKTLLEEKLSIIMTLCLFEGRNSTT